MQKSDFNVSPYKNKPLGMNIEATLVPEDNALGKLDISEVVKQMRV